MPSWSPFRADRRISAQATGSGHDGSSFTHRSYEFLHATFAEYLVAAHVVAAVVEVAATTIRDGRPPRLDDDLLFALLSHQPLSIQPPVLQFVRSHFATASARERKAAIRTLDLLVAGHRGRPGSRHFTEYRPSGRDHVRALACYSANLLLLRLAASLGEPVQLADLWPSDEVSQWRSAVALWQAGMDESGYRTVIASFRVDEGKLSELDRKEVLSVELGHEVHRHVLCGDLRTAQALAVGVSALAGLSTFPPQDYLDLSEPEYLSRVVRLLEVLPMSAWSTLVDQIGPDTGGEALRNLAPRIWRLLNQKPGVWPPGVAGRFAKAVFIWHIPVVPEVVAAAAFRHKEVFDLVLDQAADWTGRAGLFFQLAKTRHHHAGARAGWDYVTKANDLLEVILSDGQRYR